MPSRGIRKHIRKQKSRKKGNVKSGISTKSENNSLPIYKKIPLILDDSLLGERCPHCKKHQFEYKIKRKIIMTQTGNKEVLICPDCQKYYRA